MTTSNRDDMVVIPRFDEQYSGSAQHEARDERRLAAMGKKKSVFRRIARARAANKIRRARSAKSGSRRVAAAKGARGAMAAGRGAGLVANPVGAIVAAVAVGAAVAIRLGSGMSFENMGAQMNKMLLGDADEKARSFMETRKRFSGDRHIVRMMAKESFDTSQLKSIFDDIRKVREDNLKGQSKFLEERSFQVNSTLDIMILRAEKLFTQGWESGGGRAAYDKLRTNMAYVPDGKPKTGKGYSGPPVGFTQPIPASPYQIHIGGTWQPLPTRGRGLGFR